MDWHPIETAPKDGTCIMVYVPGDYANAYVVVQWDMNEYSGECRGWLEAEGERWSAYEPSHWMPLPPPPTT